MHSSAVVAIGGAVASLICINPMVPPRPISCG
jgi:hypothetical protein